MTSNERNKLRIYLEKHITESINEFQIKTGLIVDNLSFEFEGARVNLLGDEDRPVTE